MRNMGIITILVGIGVIFISILFASGYRSYSDLITNIYNMEIELYEGRKTKIREAKEKYYYKSKETYEAINSFREKKGKKDFKDYIESLQNVPKEKRVEYEEKYIRKGRVAIPLKYPLSLSVLLILFGAGIVLLSKKRK